MIKDSEKLDEAIALRSYTLMPIYAEERDDERQYSVRELLRRFEQYNVVTIVDISRVNVMTG